MSDASKAQQSAQANAAAAAAAPASGAGTGAAAAAAAAGGGGQRIAPADAVKWHGSMLATELALESQLPEITWRTDALARPDYTNVNASEMKDRDEVLARKVDLFCDLVMASRRTAILLGAGISVSARSNNQRKYGDSIVRDYASRNLGAGKPRLTHDFIMSLRPSTAHRCIAALYSERLDAPFKDKLIRGGDQPFSGGCGIIQQNHDGLLQKANLNACWQGRAESVEIHGSWIHTNRDGTKANPIIKMSGSLDDRRVAMFERAEAEADFVFTAGTSMSGLFVDSIVPSVAQRGGRVCIISIQKTPYDEMASLRVFCKLDEFFLKVAEHLLAKHNIRIPLDFNLDYDYHTHAPSRHSPLDGSIAHLPSRESPFYPGGGDAAAGGGAAAASGANRSPGRVPPGKRSPGTSPRPAGESPQMFPPYRSPGTRGPEGAVGQVSGKKAPGGKPSAHKSPVPKPAGKK